MSQNRKNCDECKISKEYYTKHKIFFIFSRSKEDIQNRFNICVNYCKETYEDLKSTNLTVASDYYKRYNDIEDLRKDYMSGEKGEKTTNNKTYDQTYDSGSGSSLIIN